MALTRRSILAAIAQCGGLALASSSRTIFVAASGRQTDPQADNIAAKLRSLVHDPLSARNIGQIYLKQVPAEKSLSKLTGLILASVELKFNDFVQLEHRALSDMLKARVRTDFGSGHTIHLNGWILSRTEARLCALWT